MHRELKSNASKQLTRQNRGDMSGAYNIHGSPQVAAELMLPNLGKVHAAYGSQKHSSCRKCKIHNGQSMAGNTCSTSVAVWAPTMQTTSAAVSTSVTQRMQITAKVAMLTYQCPLWDALDSSSAICMAASWQLALCRNMAVPTWRIMLYSGSACPNISGSSGEPVAGLVETAAASVPSKGDQSESTEASNHSTKAP